MFSVNKSALMYCDKIDDIALSAILPSAHSWAAAEGKRS